VGKASHAKSAAVRRPAVAAVAAVPPVYGHGLRLFVIFGLGMLVAFWPSYFSRLSSQPTYHPHAHGITMTLWVLLLATQAWLIAGGQRQTHRQTGLLSYALVPALVVAALNFLHFRVRDAADLGASGLQFVTLVVNALVAFLVLYALAMWYRRQPALHARFMIASVFPLFTPVTDRLIGRYLPSIVPLVPRVDGSPVVPAAGFLLADVILIALSVWDWTANRRLVFTLALAVLVL
jgi:uncharacterized membrane protein YozB (DUF420 family)